MVTSNDLKSISDDDLLRRLAVLSRESRRVESDLVAHIAEVDERRLYAREACSSMFAYCREVLHLAEHEAYLRIAAARAAKDLAAAIEAAVTEKLERIEAKRYAATTRPRKDLEETDTSPKSRYIPAAVRRAVRKRDGLRCGFVDKKGRRCTELRNLEFHHHDPFGRGGAHDPEQISLRCRTHNAYLAERDYGKDVMDRYRRCDGQVSESAPSYGAAWASVTGQRAGIPFNGCSDARV